VYLCGGGCVFMWCLVLCCVVLRLSCHVNYPIVYPITFYFHAFFFSMLLNCFNSLAYV
jgi:hypothetical protein